MTSPGRHLPALGQGNISRGLWRFFPERTPPPPPRAHAGGELDAHAAPGTHAKPAERPQTKFSHPKRCSGRRPEPGLPWRHTENRLPVSPGPALPPRDAGCPATPFTGSLPGPHPDFLRGRKPTGSPAPLPSGFPVPSPPGEPECLHRPGPGPVGGGGRGWGCLARRFPAHTWPGTAAVTQVGLPRPRPPRSAARRGSARHGGVARPHGGRGALPWAPDPSPPPPPPSTPTAAPSALPYPSGWRR